MFWLNLILLCVFVAGHCELLAMVINRLHARPIAFPTLRRLRHIHDVLAVLFAAVLFWFVGLSGPAVLRGGNWSELPTVYRGPYEYNHPDHDEDYWPQNLPG